MPERPPLPASPLPVPPRPGDERRERGDIAFLVPFFGAVLLLPPILNLVVGPELPSGLPLEVAYLFSVWALLIAGAVLLTLSRAFRGRPLPRRDGGARPAAPETAAPPDRA